MKEKVILVLVLVAGSLSKNARAQNMGEAKLNIRLHPVQTISVNASGNGVNLDYKTREDYKNGINITQENHLKIYSTGAFIIKVRSTNPTLINANNTKSINTADISITASKGTLNGVEKFSTAAINLSVEDQELISSTVGGSNRTFNINYAAKGDDQYINKYVSTQNPTVYTTEVTYSIEPK
ncbi:hypothetical protein [Kaistella sp.]|uniref:hypothetical protein n=1 Tax=Kaistella sp. TaxID=2782235 RepID=UPI003C6A4CA7